MLNTVYTLRKLNHRKDALVTHEDARIKESEVLTGCPMHDISIGSSFRFIKGFPQPEDLLITSIVKSAHIVGSDDQDKLVLPSSFDMTQDLDFHNTKDGDIIFATTNSVYLLREGNV